MTFVLHAPPAPPKQIKQQIISHIDTQPHIQSLESFSYALGAAPCKIINSCTQYIKSQPIYINERVCVCTA